jgi:hypothetical protein
VIESLDIISSVFLPQLLHAILIRFHSNEIKCKMTSTEEREGLDRG